MAKAGRASGAQCAYAYAALLDLDQHSAECADAKSVRNDDVGTSLQIVCDKGKEVGQAQEATALIFLSETHKKAEVLSWPSAFLCLKLADLGPVIPLSFDMLDTWI